MNRLALALLSLGLVGSAQAQTNFNMPPPSGVMVIGVQVVATCGVGTLSTTTPGFVTMNQLGQLCTNASGGGGGGSVTQGTVPWVDSVHYWGSSDTALGAPSNFGTSPGAVVVPGVNAALPNVTGTKAPGTAATGSLLVGCVRNTGGVTPGDTQQVGLQCGPNGEVVVTASGLGDNLTFSTGTQTFSGIMGLAQTTAGGTGGACTDGHLCIPGVVPTTRELRVLFGNTTLAVTNAGTFAVQAASTLTAETTKVIGTVRNFDGTGNNVNADPCERAAQTSTPISITTATTTRIVAPSSSNKTYICYLFLTSAAADNIGIVEGTGGTCGTGTAGVIGGTTAANGPNFAANGGAAFNAGGKVAAAVTAGTNVDLCLITSAATPLAGVIKWVQAP